MSPVHIGLGKIFGFERGVMQKDFVVHIIIKKYKCYVCVLID